MRKILIAVLFSLVLQMPAFAATSHSAAVRKPARKTATVPVRRRRKAVHRAAKPAAVSLKKVEAAGEEPADTFQAWCRNLKKRVVRSQTKRNQVVAVASVRGAEAPESPPLYWKGRAAPGIVEGSDLQEFDEALNKALEGDSGAAKMRLESFISNHGNSPLAADAKETLKRLNENAPATAAATK